MKLRRILRLGVVGPDVVAVKLALRNWQARAINNKTALYGEGAAHAVSNFQKAKRLTVDGLVGQHTLNMLLPYFTPEALKLYANPPIPLLVQPIPKRYEDGHNAAHDTMGLPGYPASDFFATAGSPVVAPEDSLVERFSGHDPAMGPMLGPHGPLGWSMYLRGASGTDYYLTHLGSRTVTVGEHVKGGTKIGTVADYAKYGTPSHTHVGVHGGPVKILDLMAAAFAPARA